MEPSSEQLQQAKQYFTEASELIAKMILDLEPLGQKAKAAGVPDHVVVSITILLVKKLWEATQNSAPMMATIVEGFEKAYGHKLDLNPFTPTANNDNFNQT